MLTAAGLGRSGILSDYDAKLLPGGRKLKAGRECRAVLDDHGIRCRPNLVRGAYGEHIVAGGDGSECELADGGSCGGILALAVRREELDGGPVDGISRRVAQDAAPGRRRRGVQRGNQGEYEEKGTDQRTGPGGHRETLYAG